MKALITFISIIAIALLLPACITEPPYTTEIVVLRDITEPHIAQPTADEILPLYRLNTDKLNGASFRYVTISDISFNKVKQIRVGTADKWLTKGKFRNKELAGFTDGLKKILSDSTKDSVGRNYSSVYKPLAQELNRLSQSASKKRILLVYSDLMENEKEMSFYDSLQFGLLKTNPGLILKYFEAKQPLNRLDGIIVYLIYEPSDIDKDDVYQAVSDLYKKLLESRGAFVKTGANITVGDI